MALPGVLLGLLCSLPLLAAGNIPNSRYVLSGNGTFSNNATHMVFEVLDGAAGVSERVTLPLDLGAGPWVRSPTSDVDDAPLDIVPLPWPFPFYGRQQTSVGISSNGGLHFNGVPPCCGLSGSCFFLTGAACNMNTHYDNLIMANNMDHWPSHPNLFSHAPAIYRTNDSFNAAHGLMVVHWHELPPYSNAPPAENLIVFQSFTAVITRSGRVILRFDDFTDVGNSLNFWFAVGLRDVGFADEVSFHRAPYTATRNGVYVPRGQLRTGAQFAFFPLGVYTCAHPTRGPPSGGADVRVLVQAADLAQLTALQLGCRFTFNGVAVDVLATAQESEYGGGALVLRCAPPPWSAYGTSGPPPAPALNASTATIDVVDGILTARTHVVPGLHAVRSSEGAWQDTTTAGPGAPPAPRPLLYTYVPVGHASLGAPEQQLTGLGFCMHCSAFAESFCAPDCAGEFFGHALADSCGVCSGGTSGHAFNADVDCAGVCFGPFGVSGSSGACECAHSRPGELLNGTATVGANGTYVRLPLPQLYARCTDPLLVPGGPVASPSAVQYVPLPSTPVLPPSPLLSAPSVSQWQRVDATLALTESVSVPLAFGFDFFDTVAHSSVQISRFGALFIGPGAPPDAASCMLPAVRSMLSHPYPTSVITLCPALDVREAVAVALPGVANAAAVTAPFVAWRRSPDFFQVRFLNYSTAPDCRGSFDMLLFADGEVQLDIHPNSESLWQRPGCPPVVTGLRRQGAALMSPLGQTAARAAQWLNTTTPSVTAAAGLDVAQERARLGLVHWVVPNRTFASGGGGGSLRFCRIAADACVSPSETPAGGGHTVQVGIPLHACLEPLSGHAPLRLDCDVGLRGPATALAGRFNASLGLLTCGPLPANDPNTTQPVGLLLPDGRHLPLRTLQLMTLHHSDVLPALPPAVSLWAQLNRTCLECSQFADAFCQEDCAGVFLGEAVLDTCQVCTGGKTSAVYDAALDCSGTCFGPFYPSYANASGGGLVGPLCGCDYVDSACADALPSASSQTCRTEAHPAHLLLPLFDPAAAAYTTDEAAVLDALAPAAVDSPLELPFTFSTAGTDVRHLWPHTAPAAALTARVNASAAGDCLPPDPALCPSVGAVVPAGNCSAAAVLFGGSAQVVVLRFVGVCGGAANVTLSLFPSGELRLRAAGDVGALPFAAVYFPGTGLQRVQPQQVRALTAARQSWPLIARNDSAAAGPFASPLYIAPNRSHVAAARFCALGANVCVGPHYGVVGSDVHVALSPLQCPEAWGALGYQFFCVWGTDAQHLVTNATLHVELLWFMCPTPHIKPGVAARLRLVLLPPGARGVLSHPLSFTLSDYPLFFQSLLPADTRISTTTYLDGLPPTDGTRMRAICGDVGPTTLAPDSAASDVCARDCNNEWGGFSQVDHCGVCYGGSLNIVANSTLDCAGICFGPFMPILQQLNDGSTMESCGCNPQFSQLCDFFQVDDSPLDIVATMHPLIDYRWAFVVLASLAMLYAIVVAVLRCVSCWQQRGRPTSPSDHSERSGGSRRRGRRRHNRHHRRLGSLSDAGDGLGLPAAAAAATGVPPHTHLSRALTFEGSDSASSSSSEDGDQSLVRRASHVEHKRQMSRSERAERIRESLERSGIW